MVNHLHFNMGFIQWFDRTYSSIATEEVTGVGIALGEHSTHPINITRSGKGNLIIVQVVIGLRYCTRYNLLPAPVKDTVDGCGVFILHTQSIREYKGNCKKIIYFFLTQLLTTLPEESFFVPCFLYPFQHFISCRRWLTR